MKGKRFYILTLFAILLLSCTDDTFNGQKHESGELVKVTNLVFSVDKADSKDIALARADSYSEVNSVTLFAFSGGQLEKTFDLTSNDYVQTSNEDERTRKFMINTSLTITTGTKTFYAIANGATATYWENCLDELKGITDEDEFKSHLFNLNAYYRTEHNLPLIPSIPLMGGETDNVTITANGNGGGTATGIIKVVRPMAQVTFNIHTDYRDQRTGRSCTFTPENYYLYSVASQSPVIAMDGNDLGTQNDAREYYNARAYAVPAAVNDVSSFTIFVPENIQNEIAGLTSYEDRDKWTGDKGAESADKTWTNAPQNSTYIVITGQYVETAADGSYINQGSTSYTIHLGDFSGRQYGNFSVERNVRYTYTMRVQGVNSIIVEAQTEGKEDQPGAEGDIIGSETASQVFDLDCHYEQAYVEYDLTDIADRLKEQGVTTVDDELIGNSFILKSSTPFAPNTGYIAPYTLDPSGQNEAQNTVGMDYKWIYFLSQEQEDAISVYPGDECKDNVYKGKYLLNPYQLCVSLGKLTGRIIVGDIWNTLQSVAEDLHIELVQEYDYGDSEYHYIARFTAFIDEYCYETNPVTSQPVTWADFTNKNDRTMLIASHIYNEGDGNSTYATARTAFIQRSIQTFYNSDMANSIDAMGVETYCENRPISLGFSINDHYQDAGDPDNANNGRENMLQLTDCLSMDWSKVLSVYQDGYSPDENYTYNGYFASTSSNWRTHKIDKPLNTSQSYYIHNPYVSPAYYACLSRNRDLNGNGKIDDNEVRWYLPACNQYLRMNIGTDAMSEASRLFLGNRADITSGYPQDFYDEGSIYYTSTNTTSVKQILWAAEIGAYGDYNGERSGLVRCVRNLPNGDFQADNVGDEALGKSSYTLKQKNSGSQNYIFDFSDWLDQDIYREPFYGSYPSHTEDEDGNRLPSGFVVARYSVGEQGGRRKATDYADYKSNIWNRQDANNNPCANYSEDGGAYEWRVPNLREMMAMSTQAELLGLMEVSRLTNYVNENVSRYFIIATDFSGRGNEREGFVFQIQRHNTNGSYPEKTGFITTESENDYIYVRCVRDMTEEDLNGASEVNQ